MVNSVVPVAFVPEPPQVQHAGCPLPPHAAAPPGRTPVVAVVAGHDAGAAMLDVAQQIVAPAVVPPVEVPGGATTVSFGARSCCCSPTFAATELVCAPPAGEKASGLTCSV